MPDAVDTVVCAPDDGLNYHPKHVEQFPDINKMCNVASCWIYTYIGILLGVHPILHISRTRVNIAQYWQLQLSGIPGAVLRAENASSYTEILCFSWAESVPKGKNTITESSDSLLWNES
jgi:hypothetical protein